MKSKRLAAMMTAAVLTGTAMPFSAVSTPAAAASGYNYAEALQKSMFFYEVQQAGKLPDWNYVQWRADSMVDEDGNETDVCTGGWFDAGDHFKFTLTNAYSASVLAWGYLEYKDAVEKIGQGEIYRNNVQWALDFLMQCDRGDEIIGTIGDFTGGSTDHNIWCSAEVYMRKHNLNNGDWVRPYDTIADSTTMALSAAALAEGYLMFKDTQPAKAKAYLDQAKTYFKTADKIRTNENGAMGSMYNPSSWVDDCMYAAIWLYRATGDQSYMDKVKNDYIPQFPKEDQSTDRKFTWGFCWDDTTQGAALLYAQETGDQEWIDHIAHHLDYWSLEGYNGKKIQYTPDGLAWLFSWGSARHASATAWIALLASDTIFKDNSTLSNKYNTWAKGQMDYIFGDNDLNMSYVLGMGDKQPSAFHHRTASGVHDDHWNHLGLESGGDEGWQTEYAHTLYGALVGGPDQTGSYKNDVGQYQYSEVAIDYNAGYTAALCALVDDYGGTTDAAFPPTETPKWAEWEVAAVINGTPGVSYTEIKMWAMNHTAWPARVQKDIEVRYYFDLSEVFAAGLSIDDVKVEGKSQQYGEGVPGHATVTGPHLESGTIYYASIKFEDGRAIQPTGQSEHRDEVQFRVSIPDAINGQSTAGVWDTSNDPSYEGLGATDNLKSADALNENFAMLVNGNLVWGTLPDGTKGYSGADIDNGGSDPTTPPDTATTEPIVNNTVWGDADCNDEVNVLDAVMLARVASEDTETGITAQGKLNADVTHDSAIKSDDLSKLLKYLAGNIPISDLAK
ncbi:MAG: glycoside hydrolase family 9 protein [Oscillospiraceae bacterium]|nr:glycoside hydrolase family 9 protein [Oscillospiraceae bacterium]